MCRPNWRFGWRFAENVYGIDHIWVFGFAQRFTLYRKFVRQLFIGIHAESSDIYSLNPPYSNKKNHKQIQAIPLKTSVFVANQAANVKNLERHNGAPSSVSVDLKNKLQKSAKGLFPVLVFGVSSNPRGTMLCLGSFTTPGNVPE